jgi:hypothetical protein
VRLCEVGGKNISREKKAPAIAGAMEAISGLLYFKIICKS